MSVLPPKCLVLDAMGVLFAAADDVPELLIPFIRSAGGEKDAQTIESLYLEASLGVIDPDAFWVRVGLDPAVEDAYLSKHRLVPGAREFLSSALQAGLPGTPAFQNLRYTYDKVGNVLNLKNDVAVPQASQPFAASRSVAVDWRIFVTWSGCSVGCRLRSTAAAAATCGAAKDVPCASRYSSGPQLE